MIELDKIYNENCCETMQKMPNNLLDICVTSPPFNVNLGKNKYNKKSYDIYNDSQLHKVYMDDMKKIFTLLYDKLKPSGRVCINISDGRNGRITTTSNFIQMMKNIGYKPFAHIIWNKAQTSNRAAWGSYLSPSSPSFPSPYEDIIIFYKDSKKLLSTGETDLTKEEFIKWSLSLWTIPPENRQKKIGHPAMFPLEIPNRCIKMLSWVNSIVYDPFLGAGTTVISAINNKRRYIGSEISNKYFNITLNRINEVKNANR